MLSMHTSPTNRTRLAKQFNNAIYSTVNILHNKHHSNRGLSCTHTQEESGQTRLMVYGQEFTEVNTFINKGLPSPDIIRGNFSGVKIF